jgi:hypothetical protein
MLLARAPRHKNLAYGRAANGVTRRHGSSRVSARLPLRRLTSDPLSDAARADARPGTGPITTAAAGLSRRIPGIRADRVSPAARTVRPAVARAPIGRTSGDAAPAHADHAYELNTATSVSWLNEQVSSGRRARRDSNAGQPSRSVARSVSGRSDAKAGPPA